MKTKIVYVLVSSDDDIYMEQLWVSLFSLKLYNPEASAVVVADNETAERLNCKRNSKLRSLIDEVKAVEFRREIPGKERSRHLKTSLRSIVHGDFLFVDTDTVITGELSEIDDIKADVAIVLDMHCKFNAHPYEEKIRKRIKRLFDVDLKPDSNYYNSGVMLVKDSPAAHKFFEEWHKCWLSAKNKPQGVRDQQSLAYTIERIGGVTSLDGIYNCQVLGSIQFLTRAKIVHFFNTQWSGAPLSVFFEKDFYQRIKKDGDISEVMRRQILNCKSTFLSPSMPIGLEDMKLWTTPSFKLLRKVSRHKLLFKLTNKISRRILKMLK